MIVRTEDEMDEVRSQAEDQRATGSTKWAGMSYEDGVAETIAWIVGDNEESPMTD